MTNDKFEQWIQECAPTVEVNATRKAIHLAVLKQRLRARENQHRNRQKRAWRSGVMVTAVVLVLIGGNFAELGSDGFDSSLWGPSRIPGYNLVVTGLRGDRMMVHEEDSPQVIEAFARLVNARDGDPLSVDLYRVNGDGYWGVTLEYQVGNIKRNYCRKAEDRPSTLTRAHLDFLDSESELMLNQIENGILPPVSSHVEIVDDIQFMIKTYHYQSKKYGLVVYKHGDPLH